MAKIRPNTKDLPQIVGVTEAAEILGIQRGHVQRVIDAGHLAPHDRKLKAGPIWLRSSVMAAKKSMAAAKRARAKK